MITAKLKFKIKKIKHILSINFPLQINIKITQTSDSNYDIMYTNKGGLTDENQQGVISKEILL